MIVTHKINWADCLSSRIFDAIEKGWKQRWSNDKKIHFFWGLGAFNISEIKDCVKKGEDYYICDIGYIGAQINRYPKPEIAHPEKTYFRICKNLLHNDLSDVSTDETRFNKLLEQDVWYANLINQYEEKPVPKDGHILLTPSSEGVCRYMYGTSQDEWIGKSMFEIKKNTKKEIVFRNKPRPGNKWYNTCIEDSFPNCSALVTNMSLSAIDAICHGVPVITDKENICSSIGETDYAKIDKLKPIKKDDLKTWGIKVANQQFTLGEMRKGVMNDYIN